MGGVLEDLVCKVEQEEGRGVFMQVERGKFARGVNLRSRLYDVK